MRRPSAFSRSPARGVQCRSMAQKYLSLRACRCSRRREASAGWVHLLERQGIRSDDSQSQIKFIHVEGIVEGW
jgi:hypothetical protein